MPKSTCEAPVQYGRVLLPETEDRPVDPTLPPSLLILKRANYPSVDMAIARMREWVLSNHESVQLPKEAADDLVRKIEVELKGGWITPFEKASIGLYLWSNFGYLQVKFDNQPVSGIFIGWRVNVFPCPFSSARLTFLVCCIHSDAVEKKAQISFKEALAIKKLH